MKRHPKRPPDIPKLVGLLNNHEVHFVIVGSVAAQLYGVELEPGDFDITPALGQAGWVQKWSQVKVAPNKAVGTDRQSLVFIRRAGFSPHSLFGGTTASVRAHVGNRTGE